MKTSKFSEAQIAFVLRQAEEGTAIGEVCRKAGISEATFYNWRPPCAFRRWPKSYPLPVCVDDRSA
jgi:putative transposase